MWGRARDPQKSLSCYRCGQPYDPTRQSVLANWVEADDQETVAENGTAVAAFAGRAGSQQAN